MFSLLCFLFGFLKFLVLFIILYVFGIFDALGFALATLSWVFFSFLYFYKLDDMVHKNICEKSELTFIKPPVRNRKTSILYTILFPLELAFSLIFMWAWYVSSEFKFLCLSFIIVTTFIILSIPILRSYYRKKYNLNKSCK